MHFEKIILKKRHDRRIRSGHPWVFSNEIDTKKTPLSSYTPGQPVNVHSASGHLLGSGYINPASLIAIRLLGTESDLQLDAPLLGHRVGRALQLRETRYQSPFYRAVFAESDALPGVIVDRYADTLVVQLTTAGADAAKDAIAETLIQALSPKLIFIKNNLRARGLESLPLDDEILLGEAPEFLRVAENGCHFSCDLITGQKTGWFYDQRTARARVAAYAHSRDVLDVCSYVGGFGVNCAHAGAKSVSFVDTSKSALAFAVGNLKDNTHGVATEVIEGDMLSVLSELNEADRRFDMVIVDPPALIPRRKDRHNGRQAYRRLNQAALRLLSPGGYLLSSSCSYHLSRDDHRIIVADCSRTEKAPLQLLEFIGQGPDHPVHPVMEESRYLKTIIARRI